MRQETESPTVIWHFLLSWRPFSTLRTMAVGSCCRMLEHQVATCCQLVCLPCGPNYSTEFKGQEGPWGWVNYGPMVSRHEWYGLAYTVQLILTPTGMNQHILHSLLPRSLLLAWSSASSSLAELHPLSSNVVRLHRTAAATPCPRLQELSGYCHPSPGWVLVQHLCLPHRHPVVPHRLVVVAVIVSSERSLLARLSQISCRDCPGETYNCTTR